MMRAGLRTVSGGVMAAVMIACAGAAARADVLYVDAAASGGATGASWADAFPDLHAALAASQPGDEIWLAGGTYRPAPAGGDRSVAFVLPHGLTIRGGFTGVEASPDERPAKADPAAPVTTLDADLNGDDGPEFANREDNAQFVVRTTPATLPGEFVLDRLCIRGASGFDADPRVFLYASGTHCRAANVLVDLAGSTNSAATLRILDCQVRDGFVGLTGRVREQAGAGVLIEDMNDVEIRGTSVESNAILGSGADRAGVPEGGAGLSILSFGIRPQSVFIEESRFADNYIESVGHRRGATVAIRATNLTMRGCVVERNRVTSSPLESSNLVEVAGSVVVLDVTSGTVEACDFTDNRTELQAQITSVIEGSIGAFGGSWLPFQFSIRDCRFRDNSIVTSAVEVTARGGALEAAWALVERCTFENNTIEATGRRLSVGGGAAMAGDRTVFDRCDFSRNMLTARTRDDNFPIVDGGGGAVAGRAAPRTYVTNSRFTSNAMFLVGTGYVQSRSTSSGGSAIYSVDAMGCVISGNAGSIDSTISSAIAYSPSALVQSRLVGCTVVNNTTNVDSPAAVSGFGVSADNCIVSGNRGAEGGMDGPQAFVRLRDSIVEGYVPRSGNVNVIDADPMFVDAANGDYRLRRGSPAIDMGEVGAYDSLVATIESLIGTPLDLVDLAGAPRVTDGDGDGVARIDIGAFEAPQVQPCSLADGHPFFGVLDISDILLFAQRFGAGDPAADIAEPAGAFDIDDVMAFAAAYSAGCP